MAWSCINWISSKYKNSDITSHNPIDTLLPKPGTYFSAFSICGGRNSYEYTPNGLK